MARKLPRFQRALDAKALASVAYGEMALSISWLDRKPGDVIVGVGVILLLAAVRLVRRSQLYRFAILLPVLDLCIELMLVALGFALVFSAHALTQGVHLGSSPSWHGIL